MWMKPKDSLSSGQTEATGCVRNVFAQFQPTPRNATASTTGAGFWKRARFARLPSPHRMPVSVVGAGWALA